MAILEPAEQLRGLQVPFGVGRAGEGEDGRGRDALRGSTALTDRSLRTELDIDRGGYR